MSLNWRQCKVAELHYRMMNMINTREFARMRSTIWSVLSSPRTVAFLKLGAAVIGVIHAIDELRDTPGMKKQIGFRVEDES